ncbi:YgjV family protein [Bradyrhizobium sp. P5_C11_2]
MVTWNGWPSLCAGAGTLFATSARLQADAPTMRRLFVCAATRWAGHNLQVGSVFALSCDGLTLAALLTAIWRERKFWPSLSRLRAAGRAQFDVRTLVPGESARPRIGAAEASAWVGSF